MRPRKRGILLVAWLGLILTQLPARAVAQQYLIHRYNDKDMLPSLAVTGVTQEPDGAMVFSTRAGLVRYDGARWSEIDLPSRRQPRSFRHIRCAPDGRLWALELDRPFRLQVFEGGIWREPPAPEPMDWGWDVLGFEVGMTPGGEPFLVAASSRRVAVWLGGRWLDLGGQEGLTGIRNILVQGGRCYLATSHGLLFFDTDARTFEPVAWPGIPAGRVQAVAWDGGFWLIGEDWIGRREGESFQLLAEDLDLVWDRNETGSVAQAGPAGGIFFGDYLNLYHFHPQRGLRLLDKASGLVSNGATGLFLDREQNLWVSNFRGVSKLVRLAMQSRDEASGLAKDEVTSVLQKADGAMVLGHPGAVTFLEPEPRVVPLHRNLPGNGRIISMVEDGLGRLWLAADKWGVGRLDPDGRIRWYGEQEGAPGQAFSVFIDGRGQLWLGGSLGLFRWTGSGFEAREIVAPDPNMIPFVRRIREGSDGSLLVCTGMLGVFQVKGDEVGRWSHRNNGMIRSTYDILEEQDGGYLVATGAGLCRVQEGRLVPTEGPDPVIDRPIYCILEDAAGNTWFGTDIGVYRWDGRKLGFLTASDGLPGREFNRDALVQTRDGRIWMGTDQGLGIYDPELDFPRETPPHLQLEAPWLDGAPLPGLDGARLSPSHYELLIPFKGISFLDEERILFRTWLEGLEPDWRPYGAYPTRSIRYTRLAPGRYRFHLQARSAAGVESAPLSTDYFTIQEPWYHAWWFTLLGVLAVLSLLGVLGALLLSRRYQSSLKAEVRERTRELEDSEREVREESQRLLSVLGGISDGVLALDRDLNVVLSNPTAQSMLEQDGEQLQGRPLAEVMPLEPPLVVGQELVPFGHDEGGVAIPTYSFQAPGGHTRKLEISRVPMNPLDAQERGWVLAFRDITDRLRLQQETIRTQQLESLGVLAGGIAHDFNNLLTIMLGNLSLVEGAQQLSADDRFRLSRMKKAGDRARALAEQLLTFAKAGDETFQDVDLGSLVRQAVSFALSGSNVTSRLDIDKTLWLVAGDLTQLNQVVQNLVINAVQAMPDGGVMRVTMANVWTLPGPDGPRPGVQLEVRDEGQGVESRHMERIFDPYFTTKGQGSGLGLTIAHSIVTQHGGLIEAESEPERGTVVRVVLPAAEKSTPRKKFGGVPSFLPGQRVLVLDDEKDVLILTEQMLMHLGLQAVGVMEGREAVETFARAMGQNRPFSVFIADLTIPGGIGGVEALAKIRELDPTVAAIVISGYSNDPVLANYRQYGFDAVIRKPFHLDSFLLGLSDALESGEIRRK